jgi:UDP-2-acetamido-3-amino-2,3-dideoxy-glucuronate N-acetyltransferase
MGVDYFVHDSSYVDENVTIGKGTRIWHFSHILGNTSIGEGCVIGQNAMIGPDVQVGNGCKFQNNISVYKGVTLEDEVFCGPSCVFTNVYNPRAFIERKHEFRTTLVKKGATIGANSTIICGCTIGRFAMIAAGAVIKADVPDYAVMAGVPARQVGWTCKCGTTLRVQRSTFNVQGNPLVQDDYRSSASGDELVRCEYCGNEYGIQNGSLTVIRETP